MEQLGIAVWQFIIELIQAGIMHPSQLASNRSKAYQKTSELNSTSSSTDEDLPYFDAIINPSNQVTCDCCRRNITHFTHFLCAWGDFCVACFVSLQPFPPSYHLIGKLNFPLFDQQWSARQELLFFTAMQKYGYGNWTQIKNEVGSSKTVQEMEEHYEKLFNKTDCSLPLLLTSKGTAHNCDCIEQQEDRSMTKNKYEMKMLKEELAKCHIKTQSQFKMVNYCPKRGDFEIEFDNDLQLIVSEMEFLQSDTPQQVQMKHKVLEIFCQRLHRRNALKDFVIERKLLDLNQLNKKDRRRTKEEKEIAAMLIPFARFTTPSQHEELIAGVAKEKEIRQQIATWIQQKKRGYKNLNDFQENSLSRRKKLDMKRKMKCKPGAARLPSLAQEEFSLCQQLQLSQVGFVLMRQTIKSEISRRGKVPVDHFYSIFKLKPATISQVVTFVLQRHPLR